MLIFELPDRQISFDGVFLQKTWGDACFVFY